MSPPPGPEALSPPTHPGETPSPAFDRALAIAVALGLIGLAGMFIARGLARSFDDRGTDFDHFFWAAQAMAQGNDLSSSGTHGYIYPPLVAWLITPLTPLGLKAAMRVWLVCNLLLTGASVWVLCRETARRLDLPIRPLMLALVAVLSLAANADQIRWEFELGQSDTIVLFGFALGLALLDRRPWLAGIALGLAFNVKYQSLLALPYLIVRRRFAAAASMVFSSIVFLLLPATTYGWGLTLRSVQVAFAGMLNHVGLGPGFDVSRAASVYPATYFRSVSITSVAARLTDGVAHPARMTIVVAIAALAILGIGWWMFRARGAALLIGRGGDAETRLPLTGITAIEWSGLIVAALAFSPHTLSRHTYLLIPAHILAFTILCHPRPRVNPWPLIIGTAAFTLGVILPPGGLWSGRALELWRAAGGATWCTLIFYFTLVWTGLAYIRAQSAAAR